MATRKLSVEVKDLMAEIRERASFDIPDGYFTAKEFTIECNQDGNTLSESQAKRIIAAELESGFLERKWWPIPTGGKCYIYRRTDDRQSREAGREKLHPD